MTWKIMRMYLRLTPPLEAGTKPMGFPKGRSGSSSLWSNTGIQTPCSIELDSGNYALDDRQWHPKGESVWVL